MPCLSGFTHRRACPALPLPTITQRLREKYLDIKLSRSTVCARRSAVNPLHSRYPGVS
jgi:hypothetical protein